MRRAVTAGKSDEPDGPVDGRRARGDERRRLIAEAVITVIGQHGAGGVTHRRVAAMAGVPLGSTTYYYATLTDLLVAGMTLAVERNAAAMRELEAALGSGRLLVRVLAERAVALVTRDRNNYLAECELYLAAAREPSLRAGARDLTATMVGVIRPWVDSDAAALALVLVYEGALFEALIADAPPEIDDLCRTFDTVSGILDAGRRGSAAPVSGPDRR